MSSEQPHGSSPRTLAADLINHVDEQVTLRGWLHTRRDLGGVAFIVLRDRSGHAQCIVEGDALREALAHLQVESVLALTGTVAADARARGGAELRVAQVEVLSPVLEPPPFEINRAELKPSIDILLDHAAVALRHQSRAATGRLLSGLVAAWREALRARSFVEIFTPKLVGSATEGGANVFEVRYFERQAYLAQSPQLYKQMLVGVHERVFEIGPVFRAEPHATSRHLNEYISLDLEFGFIDNHRDVMALVEVVLRDVMAQLQETNAAELELLNVRMPNFDTFPILTFVEALELIYREFGEDARHEDDLSPQHERWLGEWALREHNADAIFVEGFPMSKRPFYTMPDPEQPETSRSFDLLFRGLELITGGQRQHRHDDLTAELRKRWMRPQPFEGYLEAFQYGMPPEGGCAFGLERFVAQLIGAANIRDVRPFPRDINRLLP